ncbi:MAG: hypothetical protein V2A71_11405 [Candidatus Eisenbacteria bacterium]
MKLTLTVLCFVFCMVLAVPALAGNDNPYLCLEIWKWDSEPTPPLPSYICIHPKEPPPFYHRCYDAKTAYAYAVVPVHAGNLNYPICTTFGLPCKEPTPLGGFLGLAWGMQQSGEAVTFMNFTSCTGFLTGPSQAGMPAAILTSSTSGCKDWKYHLGYCTYLNMSTRTGATYIDIVATADTGLYKLINCHNEYDNGTTIGGRVQWGGTQTITCSLVGVEETSWGRVKALFR